MAGASASATAPEEAESRAEGAEDTNPGDTPVEICADEDARAGASDTALEEVTEEEERDVRKSDSSDSNSPSRTFLFRRFAFVSARSSALMHGILGAL